MSDESDEYEWDEDAWRESARAYHADRRRKQTNRSGEEGINQSGQKPPKAEQAKPDQDAANAERRPTQSEILIGLAGDAELFHTPPPEREAYASIAVDGHHEIHRIRGRDFRLWLRHQYFRKTRAGCNSDAMQTAVETIAAKAQFEGPEREVHCRVAEHQGTIYIDIGNATWRAIKVSKEGWEIVDRPPVYFRRPPSTQALPNPEPGGSIKSLRQFLNVTFQAFVLLVAYVLAALRPNTNYPVLTVTGEQGSCKSTLFRFLQRLIDPRVPEQRTLPSDEDNLVTAAKGAHLLSFDNISGMPDWLSDAICRLATGGGAGKRKLYTDDEEALFAGRRPVMLNGIEDVVARPDLVDRALMLTLEPLAESKRRAEKEIDAAFADAAPKIFGVLLDGLVVGLKNFASVSIPDKPRMADFAVWGEACTRAYWPEWTFLTAYRDNLATSVELVIERNLVADALRRFMESHNAWQGTASDLLEALKTLVGEQVAKERNWPRRHHVLSGKLRRAATPLRKIGIHISFDRAGLAGTRIIKIEKRSDPEHRNKSASGPSEASAPNNIANVPDAADASFPGCSGSRPGLCAQCLGAHGAPPQLYRDAVNPEGVWLHRECVRFWREQQQRADTRCVEF